MQMRLDGMQLAVIAHIERAQRRAIQMFVSLATPQFGLFLAVQHDRLGILIHLVEILAQKENLSFCHNCSAFAEQTVLRTERPLSLKDRFTERSVCDLKDSCSAPTPWGFNC